MSSLVSPRTTAARISLCRCVRSRTGGSSSMKCKISGEMARPPDAIVLIETTSSEKSAFFISAPDAPASIAWEMPSAVPNDVSRRIFVSGRAFMISTVAAVPSLPGITRSITITSGFSARALEMAVSPFSASPTTSMSGSVSRSDASPMRTMAWSSAIRTLIVFFMVVGS